MTRSAERAATAPPASPAERLATVAQAGGHPMLMPHCTWLCLLPLYMLCY